MTQKDEPTTRVGLDKNFVTKSTETENLEDEPGANVKRMPRWRAILCVLAFLLPTLWYWQKDLNARKEVSFRSDCLQAIGDKDWLGLIESGSAWSTWNADAADAWLFQAQGHQELGAPERAAQLLLQLPDHSKKTEAALLVAASLYFEELGQPLKAIPVLKRLLKLNETSITAHQRLIFFYGMTLQRVEMLDQIHRSIEVGAEPPDAYVYLHLASRLAFSNGYLTNQRWLENEPGSRLFQIASAIQLSAAKDHASNADDESPAAREARHAEIKELLREYPDNTSLLRYLLDLAVARDDVDEVGKLLANSPAHAWNDSVFWRIRGWYDHRFEKFDDAENAFRKSLELYPQDWETWHNLAATLRKTEELDRAEHAQRLALQGKELRRSILQLPDARSISPEILQMMRDFSFACGDRLTATSLQTRIQLMSRHQ